MCVYLVNVRKSTLALHFSVDIKSIDDDHLPFVLLLMIEANNLGENYKSICQPFIFSAKTELLDRCAVLEPSIVNEIQNYYT